MDKSKVYVKDYGNFIGVGVIGNAPPLEETIPKYKATCRYRGADFSAILLGGSDQETFMAANIYGDPFCTLTIEQNNSVMPNTTVGCIGNSRLTLEFLTDLTEALQIEPVDPNSVFKREIEMATAPLLELYQGTCQMGSPKLAAKVLTRALQMQMQRYHADAMHEAAPNN